MKRENGGRGGGKDKKQGGNGKWGGEGGGIVADNERDCKTVKRKEDMEGWQEGRKNVSERARREQKKKEKRETEINIRNYVDSARR